MALNFKHIKLKTVNSTNQYLYDLSISNKIDEGTVVTAQNQTNGKGQKGNVWASEKNKNITLSLLLKPSIEPKFAFYLNIISALAVQKTLTDLNIIAKIKWPNDVLVNTKKIAGILIENQIGKLINQSIIGIGLNVNQSIFKNNLNATSIILQKQKVNVNDVENQLLGYINFYYNLLKQSNYKLLLKLYYQHMYLYNKQGVFNEGNKNFNATLLGVSDSGLLKLKKTDNSICTYDIKQIKFVL